jgi:hypothetical protein
VLATLLKFLSINAWREGLSFGHAALDVKQADRLLDMGTSRADHVYERIVLPGGGEVRRGHDALDEAEKAARHRARHGQWHHRPPSGRYDSLHLSPPSGGLVEAPWRKREAPLH